MPDGSIVVAPERGRNLGRAFLAAAVLLTHAAFHYAAVTGLVHEFGSQLELLEREAHGLVTATWDTLSAFGWVVLLWDRARDGLLAAVDRPRNAWIASLVLLTVAASVSAGARQSRFFVERAMCSEAVQLTIDGEPLECGVDAPSAWVSRTPGTVEWSRRLGGSLRLRCHEDGPVPRRIEIADGEAFHCIFRGRHQEVPGDAVPVEVSLELSLSERCTLEREPGRGDQPTALVRVGVDDGRPWIFPDASFPDDPPPQRIKAAIGSGPQVVTGRTRADSLNRIFPEAGSQSGPKPSFMVQIEDEAHPIRVRCADPPHDGQSSGPTP